MIQWEFKEYGERLPFEELSAYSAKKIKDRVTAPMVERHCGAFGIERFDPDFYFGERYIIETTLPAGVQALDSYPNQAPAPGVPTPARPVD